LRDMASVMDIFDADQADEIGVRLLIVEGKFDHPAHGVGWREAGQIKFLLDTADVAVNLLEHREVKTFLAAEIIPAAEKNDSSWGFPNRRKYDSLHIEAVRGEFASDGQGDRDHLF
jgi:hypothetical protein